MKGQKLKKRQSRAVRERLKNLKAIVDAQLYAALKMVDAQDGAAYGDGYALQRCP